MPNPLHLKIMPKLAGAIVLVAVLVGGSVWYSQARMKDIDERYTAFVHDEAQAVANARRSNGQLYEAYYSLARMLAEPDLERRTLLNTGFNDATASLKKSFLELVALAPHSTASIKEQSGRVDQFIKQAS